MIYIIFIMHVYIAISLTWAPHPSDLHPFLIAWGTETAPQGHDGSAMKGSLW